MKEQMEAVQRMQDYIGAHLNENITLGELARVSCYSPWYSHRLFVQWTNLTPAGYIRRLRLSQSALKLRDGGGKVAEIAFEVGFSSVDGYQRAFFREFGCNPRQYADSPFPITLFRPYGVKYRTVGREKTMEEVRTVFVQAVHKPARKAVIKRGVRATDYFSYCEEVGCDVWGLLLSIKSDVKNLIPGRGDQGPSLIDWEPVCLWLPGIYIKAGTSTYVQGAEVSLDYAGAVPEGFDLVEFPACDYLMFQGEPFEEEDYCQAIEQVWSAVKRYNPSVLGYEWDENNPRIQLEPIGQRGYIELLPVRKKRG